MSSSSSVISSLSWDSIMLLLGEILTLGPSVTKYLEQEIFLTQSYTWWLTVSLPWPHTPPRLVDGVKQEDILLILLSKCFSGCFDIISFSNLLKLLYQFYYNWGILVCIDISHKASKNLDPLNAPKSRARPGPHLSNPQCYQLGWQILLFRFVTLPSCRNNYQTVTASLTYP